MEYGIAKPILCTYDAVQCVQGKRDLCAEKSGRVLRKFLHSGEVIEQLSTGSVVQNEV
jgi:hypothetical protein